MCGFISVRKSVRWLPDVASEPTSTIVLTSPQRQFVDLRILKDENGSIEGENLPFSRLDWAIAGTSSSTTCTIDGKQVSRSQFVHWIDSRTSTPENATDEGDMYPQPDGTTIEKGHMVNPDTGIVTAYEEVWDDKDVPSTDEAQVCVVLKYENGDDKGMVVKLGKYCQGFMKIGEQMSLERWEWTVRTIQMGTEELPSKLVMERKFILGEDVEVAGRSWKVVEIA
ncbi:uncharacterized protein LOC129573684 [Sitodiplosis mosellana]|uniref:uncharacterized protein LOC129573684 n=1 Tax=Sitodiplosis mosellana TaxID=263140 RepID=UPI00244536C2|nr:uncharacterized protein LOC129573684 [Sitodiplosis mosellana]